MRIAMPGKIRIQPGMIGSIKPARPATISNIPATIRNTWPKCFQGGRDHHLAASGVEVISSLIQFFRPLAFYGVTHRAQQRPSVGFPFDNIILSAIAHRLDAEFFILDASAYDDRQVWA